MLIKNVDHIGIAVKSIREILPFYTEVLNLTLEHIEEVESEKVSIAFLSIGQMKIELLEPTSNESAIAKFIDKRGEGIHHIAFGVESIDERIHQLKTEGIRMIHDHAKKGAGGKNIAFLHPKSTGNVLIELCEKEKGVKSL
ncbi:methylmalonyl-CoA epimerase [Litchfieldia salsa]|uniref:methylmalonyl-CoA epimerase n=1 Tax=Litchfieldia salsa TaxID=930152 RepID=UPI000B85B61E|nr:methylmalonyl-CoA epimerase [Litchfieldia salsa]